MTGGKPAASWTPSPCAVDTQRQLRALGMSGVQAAQLAGRKAERQMWEVELRGRAETVCATTAPGSLEARQDPASLLPSRSRDHRRMASLPTGDTAGILSFTLPFLAVTSNSGNRIDHLVLSNNKPNTCTPGGDVCSVPAGSGIAVVAADSNQVDHNQVRGNDSFGIIVANLCNAFHLSAAVCAALGIDPDPDGNHVVLNRATGNGAAPSPLIAPLPGADLLWDGTGSGNCWAHNTAVSAFPAQLPGCG